MMFIETIRGPIDWPNLRGVQIAQSGKQHETVTEVGDKRLQLILLSDEKASELNSLSAKPHRIFVSHTTSKGRHFIELDGQQIFVRPKH